MEKSKILIIVDPQNDFISGSLYNEKAIRVVPNIVKKIEEFKGDAILVTRDTHTENYLETNEGKLLPISHCIKGTNGWYVNKDIASALHKRELEESCMVMYFDKSSFGSEELVEIVKTLGKIAKNTGKDFEVEICGFVTNICVISNAIPIKTALHEFGDVTIDASCCAGSSEKLHNEALNVMETNQIITINR